MLKDANRKKELEISIRGMINPNLYFQFESLIAEEDTTLKDLEDMYKYMQMDIESFTLYVDKLLNELITREYDNFDDAYFVYQNISVLFLARYFINDEVNYLRLASYATYLQEDVLKELQETK